MWLLGTDDTVSGLKGAWEPAYSRDQGTSGIAKVVAGGVWVVGLLSVM